MSLALPGIASGLDTRTLIDSLMQVEAVPQTLLKNRVATTDRLISVLQEFNAKIASLGEMAKQLSAPGALQSYSATASHDSVMAEARSSATAGDLEFVVNQTAQRQVLVSDPATAWSETSFDIVAADGTATTITAASTSLDDVVSAVNTADAGVKAVKVATGDGNYRLQFTAEESGTQGAFTLSGSTTTTTETSSARDASVTLWSGTAAEQTITSSSNTFTDLLPGVDVTVTQALAAPVTVSVARDAEATSETAKGLVDALNAVFSFVDKATAIKAGSNGSTSGSLLTGDSMTRDAERRIMDAAIRPVNGRSPSEIGIVITREGAIEYDEAKFTAALASEPEHVEATLLEISFRLTAATKDLSDPYTGRISSRIEGQEGLVGSMKDQVLEWDQRLDARRSSLERTYAALEVQMSAMNSQMAYLTSQLASLPQNQPQGS